MAGQTNSKQAHLRLPSRPRLAVALYLFLALALTAQAQLPAGTTDASSSSQTQPPDPLLDQANEALAKADYPAALKLLTALAEKHPTDARILYDLASAQDALDQNTAAAETYRRAIAADATYFDPHLAYALLLARQGSLKEAHAELATAITLETPDPALKARAYRTLARLELRGVERADPAAASTDLLAALKLSPETPDDILLTAEIAEAANDLAGAEASYRRLLAATPNDPAATAALAHLLLHQNKPADAEPLLTAALAAHPDDIALNAQLASVYMAEANLSTPPDAAIAAKALPILTKLHNSNPTNAAVTRLLAHLCIQTGDYAQADRLLAALIAATPPNTAPDPTLLDDRGDALIHLKRPAEAEALLKRAIANPAAFPSKDDLASAASHLAFAASQNNDPAGTLQALALRATVQPQSPSTLFLAAAAHDKLHEVKQATDLYKQFLSVANGRYPDEEWEARHRLITLEHMK
jgi:tetratricopeptide (TPR) repeat protein